MWTLLRVSRSAFPSWLRQKGFSTTALFLFVAAFFVPAAALAASIAPQSFYVFDVEEYIMVTGTGFTAL